MVEISFEDASLRAVCEIRKKAVAALGEHGANALTQTLAELNASESASVFLDLYGDAVFDKPKSRKCLHLTPSVTLVFRSGHVKTPIAIDGSVNWDKVSRIRIMALEVTHG